MAPWQDITAEQRTASSEAPVGIIVGAVVGAFVLGVVITAVLVCKLMRCRRQPPTASLSSPAPVEMVVVGSGSASSAVERSASKPYPLSDQIPARLNHRPHRLPPPGYIMQAHTLLATTPATLAQIATPLLLFCSTHVGLSAVREPIISSLGRTANQLGAVGTGATLQIRWQNGRLLVGSP